MPPNDTDIRALVESRSQDFADLLEGSGLTPERFKGTIFQLWERSPDLRSCNRDSILSAVLAIADVGLTFAPALGHAYLVKFGNAAIPIVGWRGLVHLALKCGGALDIRGGVRRQHDLFKYQPLSPTEPIIHEPADRSGDVVGYYAVAFLNGGLVRGEYMDKKAVEQHRDRYSKAAKNGPWVTQFDEMAMKTVVRRLCKYLRLSGNLEKAVHVSDSIETSLGNPDEELPPDILPKGDPAPEPAKSEKLTLVPDADLSDAETTVIIAAAKKAGVRLSDLPQWISSQEKLDIAIDDLSELKASHVSSVLKALEAYSNA